MNNQTATKKLTRLAMLVAISLVLLTIVHIPFPPAPFLEYDPADVPIFIGAFAYGPLAGLALTVIASVIQGVTVSSSSSIIGIIMHIFATGAYVLVAGTIYKKNTTKKGAVCSLVAGTLVMTAVMVLCNLIFTPIFMGQPMKDVVAMLLPLIIPFNLLKAGVNSLITFFLYKPLEKFLSIK